jgi:hypothetical protein
MTLFAQTHAADRRQSQTGQKLSFIAPLLERSRRQPSTEIGNSIRTAYNFPSLSPTPSALKSSSHSLLASVKVEHNQSTTLTPKAPENVELFG